jgi:hypothetical protein
MVLADDDALDVGEDLVPGLLDLRHRPLSRVSGAGDTAADGHGMGRRTRLSVGRVNGYYVGSVFSVPVVWVSVGRA